MVFFGVTDSFYVVLCCRFLGGFFSNSQFATRKLLYAIESKAKGNWGRLCKKALYANRFGFGFGLALGSFLTSSSRFFPDTSNFSKKSFFLCSIIMSLLHVSVALLFLSIETSRFSLLQAKELYVELPEAKDQKQESENSERQVKETLDFSKCLQKASAENEHIPSEESVGPEDVKFYSPRGIVNKDLNVRKLNSARPKIDSSFNFPEHTPEIKESEKNEGEVKRTHISFIEEEFESIPELRKDDITVEEIEQNRKPDIEKTSHLRFAVGYRVLLSFLMAFVIESCPYWTVSELESERVYETGSVLFAIYAASTLIYVATAEKIKLKLSVTYGNYVFILAIVSSLLLFPFIKLFGIPIFLPVIIWTIVFYSCEALLPVGNIMIADSIPLVEREKEIEKSDGYCIAAKGIAAYIGPALLATSGISQLGFLYFAVGFLLLLWLSCRTAKYFPCMSEVPYKL